MYTILYTLSSTWLCNNYQFCSNKFKSKKKSKKIYKLDVYFVYLLGPTDNLGITA